LRPTPAPRASSTTSSTAPRPGGPHACFPAPYAHIVTALRDLADLLDKLQEAAVEQPLEYSYSHERATNHAGFYYSIADTSGTPLWFGSAEEAERKRQSDLRWRIPTFLISRPAAGPSRKAGPASQPQYKPAAPTAD
jgi:hypothetical protein